MNKPIRILHVLGGLDKGGAETMVMNLYRNIDRNKFQFDFIIHHSEKQSYTEEIESLGGNVYIMPPYNGFNHIYYKYKWENFLLAHREYTIIHSHIRSTASIFLKIAKKHGLITISHSHNTSNGTGIRALVKKTFQFPIRNIADYLLAPSLEAGEWLFGKTAIQNSNFYIMKNAINIGSFSFNRNVRKKKRKELGLDDNIVVGHIGRFEEQKNHKFLLKIFKEFLLKHPESMLVLVGKGPLEPIVRNLAESLKITDNIIFLGERSDVNELMQAIDIFVFPSFYEGLGIVAIEAQAAGLPVVASDVLPVETKVTELVHLLSLNDNERKWADKIHKLIKVKRKNNHSALVKAGYDIKETAKSLCNFYLKIMKKTR